MVVDHAVPDLVGLHVEMAAATIHAHLSGHPHFFGHAHLFGHAGVLCHAGFPFPSPKIGRFVPLAHTLRQNLAFADFGDSHSNLGDKAS